MNKLCLPVRLGLFLLLAGGLATCSPGAEPQPDESVDGFYAQLFSLVQTHSLNRRTINWTDYKAAVLARVGTAKTVPETEPAMMLAMRLLNDNHSSITVDSERSLFGGTGCQSPAGQPTVAPLAGVGYVEVPGIRNLSDDRLVYAQTVQRAIAGQDKTGLKGWIVDLRRNTGGYTEAVLGGIGPLLGNGVCGSYYNGDSLFHSSVSYTNGVVREEQKVLLTIDKPYQLIQKPVKVAVLISGATASAGEQAALAFIGLPSVRVFGRASCGISTASTLYNLPYRGYQLNLFTCIMADRTGKLYGRPIIPNETVPDDQVISRATQWINQ